MRILSFNWHTPYLSMLARLEHEFEIAPPNIDAPMKSWDETMRPLTPNVTPITKEQALKRLAQSGYYDLLLAHNVKDIMMALDFKLPKILVFHNKLSTEAALGKKPEIAAGYREQVKSLASDVYCVFISQTKRHDWGMPGQIIMPGVDVSLYGGYAGSVRRALRVGNSIKSRDMMTGFSLQEEVLKDLPNILLGENPDVRGSKVSDGWEGLKAAYRENRLLLNTTMPPWEDGYNLSLLEAMATGMPVVSVANPTCPITDGVDGFTGENADELREKVVLLLDDEELAKRIGAEGRKTVERLFPMSAFLEKWDNAIRQAVEWYPAAPKEVFPKKTAAAPARKVFQPKFPNGKNVFLSYTSYPATTGAYIERAFRGKHNVVTAGAKINQYIIDKWKLHNLKTRARTHDIHTEEFTVKIADVIGKTPEGFAPDFLLWVDTGIGGAPEGLDRLPCPSAAYLIDTHIHTDAHIETAKKFDVTFLAQRAYIPEFNARGVKNVYWLPLACDPEIHGKAPLEKTHDVGFVGSLTSGRRVDLLMKLAQRAQVRYGRLFLREMADFFCRSHIVFNNAIKDDLNMRVFEAMCAGSMLLTDHADGLDEFFKDGEHLAIYDDDNIAEVAERYIDNPDEREKIAEAGRQAVLSAHTYSHRVDEIVRVMDAFTEARA